MQIKGGGGGGPKIVYCVLRNNQPPSTNGVLVMSFISDVLIEIVHADHMKSEGAMQDEDGMHVSPGCNLHRYVAEADKVSLRCYRARVAAHATKSSSSSLSSSPVGCICKRTGDRLSTMAAVGATMHLENGKTNF